VQNNFFFFFYCRFNFVLIHGCKSLAAGIALLAVILTALLILGCWYYRRRGGYKMIRVSHVTQMMRAGQYRESGPGEENKVALNEFSNLQPAVHTHTRTGLMISDGKVKLTVSVL
uniref:Melan-A n=1 Tax=Cyprinus carpio TaxID=7962 RepID=A0A8C2IFD9_CYPCA